MRRAGLFARGAGKRRVHDRLAYMEKRCREVESSKDVWARKACIALAQLSSAQERIYRLEAENADLREQTLTTPRHVFVPVPVGGLRRLSQSSGPASLPEAMVPYIG